MVTFIPNTLCETKICNLHPKARLRAPCHFYMGVLPGSTPFSHLWFGERWGEGVTRPQYKVPDTEGREGALYKFTYQIIFSFHAWVDIGSTSSPGCLFKAGQKRPGDEVTTSGQLSLRSRRYQKDIHINMLWLSYYCSFLFLYRSCCIVFCKYGVVFGP